MAKETFQDYKSNTAYEITINFDDQHQLPNDDDRVMKCKRLLQNIMDLNTWNYHLRPELSQPKWGHSRKMTRVHYHGIIYFKNNKEVRYFLQNQLNKLFKISSTCINAFRQDYWPSYITKQKHLFLKCESLRNISLDDMMAIAL